MWTDETLTKWYYRFFNAIAIIVSFSNEQNTLLEVCNFSVSLDKYSFYKWLIFSNHNRACINSFGKFDYTLCKSCFTSSKLISTSLET